MFWPLNIMKIEGIISGPEQEIHHLVSLNGISFTSSTTVRNLGIISVQNFSFKPHIKEVSKIAFFHLCNISKVMDISSCPMQKN